MTHRVFKRLFDLVFAGLGLLLLAPLGFLVGLLIKASDRGPVFYGQTRIGQFGKPFRIWKFRSMVVNADLVGAPVTSGEDRRITPLGRVLRRTKLDELPQLWNVLKGDMSLVGPRPEVPRYVQLYTPEQRAILKYKPGITDIASLLFRHEEELLQGAGDLEEFYVRYCLPRKIELNRQYAEREILLQDFWIIFRTLLPAWVGVLLMYCGVLSFSFWVSYQLKADFHATARDWTEFRKWLPWVVLPQLIFLVWQGQIRGLLSYFSIPEMRRTFIALACAFLVQLGWDWVFAGRLAPSGSVLLMDFLLSFFIVCAVRMGLRLLREQVSRRPAGTRTPPRRVALIGTGEMATNLLLDFARSQNPSRKVVAFFDDNPQTWHKRPHDIPVVGMPECLLNRPWAEQIDEVIVTLPEADSARTREIVEMLKSLPVKVIVASGWPVLRAL